MTIIWEHMCTARKGIIKTHLDKCPFCNVGRGYPRINPHLIDELHAKIKREKLGILK